MIHSMTGFGDAHASRGASRYSVELKSLNNRYFKPTLRLPDEVAGLEPEIESLLRKRLGRGSILLTLKMKTDAGAAGHTINTEVLQNYASQIRGAGFDVQDIDRLLWLPGVVIDPAEAASSEDRLAEHRETILKLVGEAIDHLIATRRHEGKALLEDLLVHTARVKEHLEAIAQRAGGVIERYHEKILNRVNELLARAELEVAKEDLLKEVAVYADRSDISEEIQRLGHHVEVFEAAGQGDEEHVGRRLDFIAQEMLREANTIGSKAGDADIAGRIVEIKSAIDRIKEQVQNVE